MTSEPAEASKATVSGPHDDHRAITLVRDAFLAADNAGDADAMTRLMADDIVVLHPYCGVIDGKDAVRTFMGHVLGDVHAEFDKHATYSDDRVEGQRRSRLRARHAPAAADAEVGWPGRAR